MIFKSISLEAFGPFQEETTISFTEPDLNLVMGPNFCGKSLLMRAIGFILFGLPEDEVEYYRNGANPVGKLHFGLEDRDIEVIRYFEAGTGVIWDLSGEEPTCLSAGEDEKSFRSELARLIGFHDEDVAYGTTFVRNGDMGTRIGEKLRHALAHAKRADYQRIVAGIKPRLAALEGEAETIERTLAERSAARQRADDALRQAMGLEAEAETLDQELATLSEEVAAETATRTALGVLEGLQAERHDLEGQVSDVERSREKVESLQAELSANLQRVESEHAPLIPLEASFLADLDALETHRTELVGVQAEVDAINARRAQVQSEVQKLTDDLHDRFGPYKDLPDNFPSLLALYPTRVLELERVTGELEKVDASLSAQHGAIDQNFARFKPFDESYEDQLRDLDVQERYWRQQLADLEADMARCRETATDIGQADYNLQHDFGGFATVAKDFRSRVRNWHRVWEELKARRGPFSQAQEEIGGITAALERIGQGETPEAWATALADLARLEGDQATFTAERDELLRLHGERKALLRRIDSEFAHLKDKARPDYPDKLREHISLRRELAEQTSVVDEARKRLQAAEAVATNRFARFRQDGAWGHRLEQHRHVVEKAQATLDRLKHEEEEVEQVLQALEQLDRASGDETFDNLPATFPEALREYADRKARLLARDREEADYAERFKDFLGAAPDLGDRLATWQSDRETVQGLAKKINDVRESIARHDRRVAAVDIILAEDFAPYQDRTDDLLTTVGALQRSQARQREVAAELQAAQTRHKDMVEEKSKENKLGALLGLNAVKAKDIAAQEARVTALQAQAKEAEGQVKKALKALGKLADRDPATIEKEFQACRKLQDERSVVQGERQAAAASLESLQKQQTTLEARLRPLSEQFNIGSEAEALALLQRFQAYREAKSRLASTTEEEARLAEAGEAIGHFSARFSGDPAQFGAVAEKLLGHYEVWKNQSGEREALKRRLGELPHQTETALARRETLAGIAEDAERIGIAAGESLEQLEAEWRELQNLERQMAADEAIVKDPEGQSRRLAELTERIEALAADLGILVAHPDVEALIGEINAYFELLPKVQELDDALAAKTPLDTVESHLATATRQLRGLDILGVKPDVAPEAGLAGWKNAAERLPSRQSSLTRVLEVDARDGSTIIERLQKRLDEMAAGLGDFTELTDLDATMRRYDEYLALTVRLEGLKKTLEVMPPEAELQANHRQVTAELDEARGKLGLLPGESIRKVADLHGIYRDLMERLRKSEEERNRLLAGLSTGDRSGRESGAVLEEMKTALEDLRQSLGGFEEEKEEAEDVVLEFKATQELKARIRSLHGTLEQMRRAEDLEAWIEQTQAPVRALEDKLSPAGDPGDVPALRTRFAAFAELQQTMAGLREALGQHPTLPLLADTREHLGARIEDVQGRIRTLLEDAAGLARWQQRFTEEKLRPAIEDNLTELEAKRTALRQKGSDTQTRLRQHNEEHAGDMANLAALDEDMEGLRRRQGRVVAERDGLQRGLDILGKLLEHVSELLGGGLQVRAQGVLNTLTEGRWTDLSVEGKPLEPLLKAPQGGVRRGDHVFGGLRDQLYFALRVALSQEMQGSIRLPFLIDDPFLRVDPTQLPQALNYLRQLAKGRQVILFTHDERFRTLGPVVWDFANAPAPDGASTMTKV